MATLKDKISKRAKDIIQKHTSSLFKDATLEFYGVKTAKIIELINVELPVIEVSDSSTDFVFLLEDDTYLHMEFQSTHHKKDMIRFAMYDMRLYERDGRDVNTLIIYTSDVVKADTDLNIGSITYRPNKVMMIDYNGDEIYEDLSEKLRALKELTDVDILKLIFLPLMRSTISRYELAENSVKLAQTIQDATRRNACIASTFAFANKYLNRAELENLKGVLRMTELATMFVEEGIEKGIERGIERGIWVGRQEGRQEGIWVGRQERDIEVAKDMLKENEPIEKIIRYLRLDESTIIRLKTELDNE